MKPTMTRIETVMDSVRMKIASRAYLPGTRLPSVRAQATAMGLSVSTVVEAYERLCAEEVIYSRQGSGFYVAGPIAPLALSEIGPRLEREVDPLWISRQSLESDASVLKPGCGWLPTHWMYEAGMRRALRTIARADRSLLTDYAPPQGLPALRQFLARRMGATAIEASPEQILLTDSGTQAIDLICRFFLQPGDAVLVDDPCYFNFHALLRAHRVNAVGVPFTPTGPDLTAFEAALRQHAPRLYITNSGIHNPTGAALSSVTAHRLLTLAEGTDLVIIEDDIFADFESHPAPRLAALDGLSRVIHMGSFSKTISASMRCGYIAAPSRWVDGLTDLKIATQFGGGQLASAVLLAALTDSGYRKHMATIRLRLAQGMDHCLGGLGKIGITPWLAPQAGMFVWCRLPKGADAAKIASACLRLGVVLAPGNAFSQSQGAGDFLRFNVAQCMEDTDNRMLAVLAQVLADI
ncbi:aminotransferase-like domain-containing protein [Biostraticola tofi]|uniref:GntR family transcriptional regulator n=1 Tax=Biostraticola tofi TaxID=466109 RepID=A0A4R3YRR4_9GAMM|nr:PLP-dependent aminotransferase family protein [Biostraticola tofi]TCV95076.1 GntR family transcriptional regulator [Biostraticola tofi]